MLPRALTNDNSTHRPCRDALVSLGHACHIPVKSTDREASSKACFVMSILTTSSSVAVPGGDHAIQGAADEEVVRRSVGSLAPVLID